MDETITILMPVFNREEYIIESVKSALKQSYKNKKLLIYDDGSTDRTPEILDKFQKKHNNITIVRSNKNQGVGSGRNILLNHCDTQYALWFDSDDLCNSKRIELQYNEMVKNPEVNRVFCNWTWLRKKGEWKADPPRKRSLAFATLLFKVDKTVLFNPKLRIGGEDWQWVQKMRKKYPIEVEVPKLLYYVRAHNDRIGIYKRKIRKNLPPEVIAKLTYKEMVEYCKKEEL